jgi:glycosyltransferase involved in cell wall biosynthesis
LRRRRIAFFYELPPTRMPSYVARDFQALGRMADVTWHPSLVGPAWRRGLGPRGWWPGTAMRRAIREADLVVEWFAVPSAPVVGARLLGKPSLVIAGGYDVAAVPEIGYGRMLTTRTRFMGRIALEGATRVLCVSRFNQQETLRYAPRATSELLYHGFEATALVPAPRQRQVITVGALRNDYLERKGLLAFARASRQLPELPFLLVGRLVDAQAVDQLRASGGPNLVLAGELSDDALRLRLAESAVYVQLSVHEAFGCAVAEAMLARCTPVVTRAGALPEVVGDCGHYANSREPADAAAAIARALEDSRGDRARARVLSAFPWHAREAGLRRHVEALVPESVS